MLVRAGDSLYEDRRKDMSNGLNRVQVGLEDGYYYQILSDYAGIEIEDEYQLMEKLKELSASRESTARFSMQ